MNDDGSYRYTDPNGRPFEGSHKFKGDDEITFVSSLGTTVWRREVK